MRLGTFEVNGDPRPVVHLSLAGGALYIEADATGYEVPTGKPSVRLLAPDGSLVLAWRTELEVADRSLDHGHDGPVIEQRVQFDKKAWRTL